MTESLGSDALFDVVIDILAVTVLIDNRVKDRELVEFVHVSTLHNHDLRPEKILSRRMLLRLFDARTGRLMTALANDEDGSFKQNLLSKIKDKALQRSLLSSIFTIATCDYELHDEENDFIRSALKVWNTHMPVHSEIEAVA